MQRLNKVGAYLTLMALFSAPMQARASVLYDVVVSYADGFVYAFTMEFANSTGTKTQANLIGGDFTSETLTSGVSTWVLDVDAQTNSLSFNADTSTLVNFTSTDEFSYFESDTIQLNELALSIGTFGAGTEDHLAIGTPVVTLRTQQVPEPATSLLLAAGFSAWWAGSRRVRRRQEKLASA